MAARIDLDALEQLTQALDEGAWISCSPATISALIRAVRAALGYHGFGNIVGNIAISRHELDAALEPFRDNA